MGKPKQNRKKKRKLLPLSYGSSWQFLSFFALLKRTFNKIAIILRDGQGENHLREGYGKKIG